MQFVIIFILILAVLLVIFTLQNTTNIDLSIFFWELKEVPLVLVLLSCLLLGYLVSLFYFYPKLWKLKRDYNRMVKFNSELEELHEMDKKYEKEESSVSSDPEGFELDDEDDFENPFFKD